MTNARALFTATRRKPDALPQLDLDEVEARKPRDERDPLDFDPTPWEATAGLIRCEAEAIRRHQERDQGPIWEPAVGAGHMADVLMRAGFDVIGSDIVDRGWPGTIVKPFGEFDAPLSTVLITNPPYNLVNARDASGWWVRHAMALDVRYMALLLNWDWIAAKGLDGLLALYPPSRVYVCCWKIDFRGGGSPPQRNGWFIWDRPGPQTTELLRMPKPTSETTQEEMTWP